MDLQFSLSRNGVNSRMKISLMTRFGLWIETLTSNKASRAPAGKVSSSGEGVSSILFILPPEEEHYRIAEHFLKSISISNKTIVFLCSSEQKHLASPWLTKYIFTYSEINLNRWRLPNPELISKLQNAFDAVVDMSPIFYPISAILTKKSNALLRIGLNDKDTDEYYNIISKKNRTDSLEKAYINIQQLLGL